MSFLSSKPGSGVINNSIKSSGSRIQHPHAHYNKLGELKCLICGIRIKSDALWQTHIASKAHQLVHSNNYLVVYFIII